MSDFAVSGNRGETSQSMLRVWMAISAVWIAFWLLIVAIVLATVNSGGPIAWQLPPFAGILLLPPLGLLTVGMLGRWVYLGLRAAPYGANRSAPSASKP